MDNWGFWHAFIFHTPGEGRGLTEAWRLDYNEERPHESLGGMTPAEYRDSLRG